MMNGCANSRRRGAQIGTLERVFEMPPNLRPLSAADGVLQNLLADALYAIQPVGPVKERV
jgi:hypothetical protein